MCGLRFVWVYLIFPLVPNLTFLYLVWPIGWIASIICALFVYFPTKKKLASAAAQTAGNS
jgi:nicotinamide riboside transporter PnuC